MIYIDPRDGPTKDGNKSVSVELRRYIRSLGQLAELERLDYGDFCFEGCGPSGRILVGIERKSLHDLLNCIDDGRYNQQRIGMAEMYKKSLLIVEGLYRSSEDGFLLEGWRRKDGPISWGYCNYRTQKVMYHKLRYLFSVALSNVIITRTTNLWETANEVAEWYQYFQTPWHEHKSMLATQELAIPSLEKRPPLVLEWAARIDKIGVKRSFEAQHYFGTPIRLANSDEQDWMRLSGIGAATAIKIVKQIQGREDR